jgi:tetratricopeptide (TPR) repeat protein
MKTRFLGLLLLCSAAVYGQTRLADKFFENYGYIKAIELYEKAVENGNKSAHVLTRLGDAYYNNSKSKDAAYWYGMALKEHKNIDAEYLYKYIQSLRSIGNYEEADKWFKELQDVQKGDSRLKGYNPDEVDLYNSLTTGSDVIVKISNLPFNSENSDFGPFVYGNRLYFASANRDSNKIYNWNKEPFLDLYEIEFEETGDSLVFKTVTQLNSEVINTDFHEANAVITNDGKTMYFTRDNVNKRNRLQYNKKGTTHLKIYRATYENGGWNSIEELPINDEFSSTGHPALSPDNSTLYFVSDREGGYGQTDLYSVSINTDGTFGEPQNLGNTVNTEGKRNVPFVAKDSTLYFSSDGHLNLGLLDIFKSDVLKSEQPITENLGAPYNSGYDDFGFYTDSIASSGFFSSNRPKGVGSDDIYRFMAAPCQQKIKGSITDDFTGLPLTQVTVRLIDETGKVIHEINTKDKSDFNFDVDCNKVYTVVSSKPDYKDKSVVVLTTDDNHKVNPVSMNMIPFTN